MRILGISCYFHDAAAVLLEDGKLIAAAEEERFTRKKHDYDFPKNAIDFCLARGGITGKDIDYAVFFEKPFAKFDRLLRSSLQGYPRTFRMFEQSMRTWLMDKLWIKSLIGKSLGIGRDRILFSEHHLSHSASSYFCSPFEESAVVTFDGVGEWSTTTMGVGRGSDLTLTHEQSFPHSIGLLYSAFTAFLGFEVNEGEYKVMGMAPYGTPRFVEQVWKTVRQNEDGTYSWKFDNYVRAWPPFGMPEEAVHKLWSSITCPTLLIRGTESWASDPNEDGRAQHFQNATVANIEDAGHWAHHDQLDVFMGLVNDFFDG